MRRNQKIVVTGLWAAAVLGMLSLLASGMLMRKSPGGGPAESGMPILFDAPAFSLTDQAGSKVTTDSLHGKVWVASLFFTSCPGICPMMTARLRDMQQSIASTDVQLVSFSLDPEHDTPAAMRKYADKIHADPARWHFVTGTQDQMFNLAFGLKLGAEKAHDNQPIIHSQKALLIDGAGHVRGQYDTDDEASLKQLAADATTLAAESVS